MVTFAYADLEEDRKNLAACHDAYDSLVSRLSQDVEEMRSAIVAEVQVAKGPELPNAPGAGAGADGDADMNGDVARLVEEREARGRLVAERRGADVEDLQVALSVVWIMYMRFARRAEVSLGGAKNIAFIRDSTLYCAMRSPLLIHRASKPPEEYSAKLANPQTSPGTPSKPPP